MLFGDTVTLLLLLSIRCRGLQSERPFLVIQTRPSVFVQVAMQQWPMLARTGPKNSNHNATSRRTGILGSVFSEVSTDGCDHWTDLKMKFSSELEDLKLRSLTNPVI